MTATLVSPRLQPLFYALLVFTSAESIAGEEAEEKEESLDMAFLEYLGMWDESDEDWLLLDEERTEPVPEGEESTEKKDES